MKERWSPVPLAEFSHHYEVSDRGRVRPTRVSRYSKNKAKILKPVATHKGYLRVSLYANGVGKTVDVHRLVGLAFLAPMPNASKLIRHLDDNKANNRLSNLAWGTDRDNFDDAVRNSGHDNKRERNGRAKLTEADVADIRRRYAAGGVSQQSLADEFHVHQTQIGRVIRSTAWKSE